MQKDGPWYVTAHRVFGTSKLDLGESSWADWSRGGDLLFAREAPPQATRWR